MSVKLQSVVSCINAGQSPQRIELAARKPGDTLSIDHCVENPSLISSVPAGHARIVM